MGETDRERIEEELDRTEMGRGLWAVERMSVEVGMAVAAVEEDSMNWRMDLADQRSEN